MMQILSRILSCMGFFTQIDKKDLEKILTRFQINF